MLAAFGYFVWNSTAWVIQESFFFTAPDEIGRRSYAGSLDSLSYLNAYELVTLIALSWFLWVRGWRAPDIGIAAPRASDGVVALALLLMAVAPPCVVAVTIATTQPELASLLSSNSLDPTDSEWDVWNVTGAVLSSIINSVFEETFVSAYVVTVLNPRVGSWKAVGASVALRLAYHLYKGAFGAISTAFVGLIFALWFSRTRRLWPLIFAHGLLDLIWMLS